jgi:excisionase family DNA binding protein
MPKQIAGKTYYTVLEVAGALDVTPQTVRAWAKRGRIKAHKMGLPILISEDSLRSFIDSSIVPTSINTTLQK